MNSDPLDGVFPPRHLRLISAPTRTLFRPGITYAKQTVIFDLLHSRFLRHGQNRNTFLAKNTYMAPSRFLIESLFSETHPHFSQCSYLLSSDRMAHQPLLIVSGGFSRPKIQGLPHSSYKTVPKAREPRGQVQTLTASLPAPASIPVPVSLW